MSEQKYSILYDAQGELFGVHISPELWEQVEDAVLPLLREAAGESTVPEQAPEPMSDWDDMVAYWDLPYPLERTVLCEHCGTSTEDWMLDEPRLFRLKAANFGGLASFECQNCKARVTKRHFKDGVRTKTVPFTE